MSALTGLNVKQRCHHVMHVSYMQKLLVACCGAANVLHPLPAHAVPGIIFCMDPHNFPAYHYVIHSVRTHEIQCLRITHTMG